MWSRRVSGACLFHELMTTFRHDSLRSRDTTSPTWRLYQVCRHATSHDARFTCRRGASYISHSGQIALITDCFDWTTCASQLTRDCREIYSTARQYRLAQNSLSESAYLYTGQGSADLKMLTLKRRSYTERVRGHARMQMQGGMRCQITS